MKYTKQEKLDIGRRIYDSEITRYQAAELYKICEGTARTYMRMYRDANNLPAKLLKARIAEARLKKGYAVKWDGTVILYGKKNTK